MRSRPPSTGAAPWTLARAARQQLAHDGAHHDRRATALVEDTRTGLQHEGETACADVEVDRQWKARQRLLRLMKLSCRSHSGAVMLVQRRATAT